MDANDGLFITFVVVVTRFGVKNDIVSKLTRMASCRRGKDGTLQVTASVLAVLIIITNLAFLFLSEEVASSK
mgnify:CR=1 FL=1